MGRKRPRAGQLVCLFTACVILSHLLGCTSATRRVASEKELVTPVSQEVQNDEGMPWESLQRARAFFLQGNYEASLAENQKVLAWAGEGQPADRALFNMGLIYAHEANAQRDPGKSLIYFRRVCEEFPQSPLAEDAKIWTTLLQKYQNRTKEMVDLTQENVALLQENRRLAQRVERTKKQEETVQAIRDPIYRDKPFLDLGNWEASVEQNQKILSTPGKNIPKDQALFQLGILYAYTGNPKRNVDKSISFFQRLLKEYPQSPLVDEAKAWLSVVQENLKLNQENLQLNQMIEKSKEVDIAIEEKKREKGR